MCIQFNFLIVFLLVFLSIKILNSSSIAKILILFEVCFLVPSFHCTIINYLPSIFKNVIKALDNFLIRIFLN